MIEDKLEEESKICYEAYTAYKGSEILWEKLKESGMAELFTEIEMPLVFTLYDMEQNGVRVEADALKAYGERLGVQIAALEQEIYEEMELTPEMVKSIRTLCATCLRHFVEAKAFKIALVPSPDRSMDTCTVCQMRRGYDYVVMYR